MDRRCVSNREEEEGGGIPPRGSYRYYILSAGDRHFAAIGRSDQLGNTRTHGRRRSVGRHLCTNTLYSVMELEYRGR
jgi:hypothetical protein